MKRSLMVLSLCLVWHQPTYGSSVGEDLHGFFQSMGSMSNVTPGGVFEDQAAGYATGGSFVMRNRVRSENLLSVDLPKFKAGCGGIDLFMGGLSYIKKEALVSAIKSIGSNSLTYATMLGIQTLSPQITNLLNELQTWAQKANAMSINSCEMGQQIVGGLWPKSSAASQKICQDAGTNSGLFDSFISAKHGCGAGGETEKGLNASRNGEFKDVMASNVNMAWHILKDHPLLSGDKELAEFMMTISGTLVIRTEKDRNKVQVLPSLAHQDNLIQTLLQGGSVELYACDEHDHCLNPTMKKRTIKAEKGFLVAIEKILVSLQSKIDEAEGKVTQAEKDFIAQTRIPIFHSININSAFKKGAGPIDISEYSDFIALEIVHNYLNETMDVVHRGLQRLKNVQIDGGTLEMFEHGIHKSRSRMRERYGTELQKLTAILSLEEKTALIEKQLHAVIGRSGFHQIAF